ncbi:uncharacterized protein EV420DRAFT_1505482 [Desarmillaria tabescens]|uniref:REJ domain-containing protein n=1 Tax=Armillaria tabescens TaxID=1929756 RepID=A0AA39NJI6_ARMTA|nr:uncharacterized protein EV420DRAFT_1505482 [Desarmillaria tabescens]KAK0466816.1 hypothetical protein EV420DRAFT_1505482 [Desarmillaria tabescens]
MLGLVQDHRMLRVRQASGSQGGGQSTDSGSGTSATASQGTSPSATATSSGTSETTTSASPTSETSTSQTPSVTTSPTSTSSSSSTSATSATSAETTATTATTASNTSTSASPSTTTTSATSSSTSITNTSASTSATSAATTTSATSSDTHVDTTAAADESSTGSYTTFTYTQTSSYRTVTRVGTSQLPGSTVSAGASGSSSSSLNTKALAGGIAGGLIAVAILGFGIAFVLRRRRNRRRADEFEASQFRRSAIVLDEDTLDPHRPAATPPQMYERGHSVAPSITSTTSPGMAGQGAYYAAQSDAEQYEPYTAHPYAATPYATTTAPPVTQGPPQPTHVLQPRPQYTFGQVPTPAQNVMSDDGHENMEGAYSSEPTPQAPYNQEAYGNYHAYSPDNAGYGNTAGAHARTRTNDDDAYGGI